MIASPQFQSNRSRVIMTRNLQVHLIMWPILVPIVTCLLASTAAAQSLSNSSTLVNLENLGKSNYIIGIAQIGARESISSLCGRELSKFLESVENRDVWAIKLVDSFGHVPDSFTWGNVFWFPNRELCYDLNDPYKISLADYVEKRYALPDIMSARSPFPVMFRVIFYNFTSPMYIDFKLQIEHLIHVGLCYPASCSEDEIITYSNYYFGNKTFDGQTLLDISMREVEKGEKTKVPGFRWDILLNPGVLLFITILVSVLVFGLFAEIITRLKTHHSELKKAESKPEKSAIEAFLLCFSLGENSEKMVKAEDSKHFLPVIAGLRSIVCIWVTIFHVYYYSLFTIKNAPFVFAKLELMILQPIIQSCFYVDIFFVISAFLLVYNFLSNESYIRTIRENQFFGNLKLFLKFLLHRYLRLMPVLIIAMVISEIVFEAVDNCSPFLMDEYNGLNCRKTWWWNLLLINNFLNLPEICISWSWYVGCEMQYFALFLLFLFIYIRDERLGKALFCASAVFFMIVSFLCQYFSGASFKHDVIFTTLRYLYLKPWVRINPYFGGALMGFLYHKTKASGLQASRPPLAVFWMIALIVYLFTIFMSFWKETPIWAVAAIMSIGKTIFGLIIGGVIFLCQHGYGGFFNTFMGNRVFLYMNKFCYSIYMLAPLTVGVMFGLRNEGTLFNELASGADFMAIILITFGGSHLSVWLLEIPFQRISNRFILKRK